MKQITVKLEENEYTSFSEEFEKHDVIILSGARGAGKSYPVAKYIKNMLLSDSTAKFVYVRISKEEISTVDTWCNDLDLDVLTGGDTSKLLRGKPGRGDITLIGMDSEGMECYRRHIGKAMDLNSSYVFKSGNYKDYKAFVFEEYTQLSLSPKIEKKYVFNFLENVTSIFRDRPKKIFLLCNNLKNIPLLDRTIDEMTDATGLSKDKRKFKNPIKIKIFRKTEIETKDKNWYERYLDGELLEQLEDTIRMEECVILYMTKDFIIRNHIIHDKKILIHPNKGEVVDSFFRQNYLRASRFVKDPSRYEIYYQHKGVENKFLEKFEDVVNEITSYVAEQAVKYNAN